VKGVVTYGRPRLARQGDPEDRATVRLAGDRHRASMLVDDALDDEKTETMSRNGLS
jgi:hypothetical protein